MNQFIVAFITGLTTGGLSCLAVQGGLLASSLAHQLEQDMVDRPSTQPTKGGKARPRAAGSRAAGSRASERLRQAQASRARPNTALPIALFLTAKVAAYTLLGFLLGALG